MADNLESIYCPACGKRMKKIYMPEQKINLDVCINGCGGIYFDNREFLKVDEPNEDITPLIEIFEGKTFKKTYETETRICPVCGMKMVKNFASAKHEIQVDECYSCGGKFLDNQELEKIRAQYTTEEERAADVIKKLYDTVGLELQEFQQKYDERMANPALATIIAKGAAKHNAGRFEEIEEETEQAVKKYLNNNKKFEN